MKKLLAVAVTGVFCVASLCLTACDPLGDVSQVTSVSEITEDESGTEVSEDVQSESAEVSEEVSDSVQSDPAVAGDFSIGRMEGRTYINEYFDFYCALDNNWDISSEEELILANRQSILSWNPSAEGVDTMSWNDASIQNTLENINIDMIIMEAQAPNKALVIMVQKTGFNTEEECTQFVEDYANSMETQYSAWSNNVEVNITETVFKGDQINDSIDISIESGGQTTYQKLMFIHKDGYCLTIMAISSSSHEEAESFYTWFGNAEDAVIIEDTQEVQYEVDYLIGTVEEQIYTNEALGFRFEGGETCQYATVEELQAKTGKSYDKDTLNKLLKWGNCVTIADIEREGSNLDLMLYLRDAEYESGVTVRGNEEYIIEDLKMSMKESFDAYCTDVELKDCSEESLGEVPMSGFDLKGTFQGTGKYVRVLFIQNEEFFGCIMLSGADEEELQVMTDLIVSTEE